LAPIPNLGQESEAEDVVGVETIFPQA
jgi:hypothetical protein